jgi:poly-gamma-glutamate synthesis protein (capsule biosynthesis protein)
VRDGAVVVFLCGDVMTGRGVDQIMPCPGDARLAEPFVRDAGEYVGLAEAVNGPIPRPVDFGWPWGDALRLLDEAEPDVRVVNLETSITRCGEAAAEKSVHYRMCPDNIACLTAGRPDVCALANNHVLDFGRQGLLETLDALAGAGLTSAGAGRDADEARRPAVIPVDGGARVVVFSFGAPSSGIPRTWAAAGDRAGVDMVPELSGAWAAEIADRVRAVKRPGDVVIASVHWGSNWGYEVGDDQVRFAHWLVDGGVDIVHGHSSHHPRPVEVYRDRLVLYGCGDFIDDYEGISGYESYRDDLRLAYLVSVRPDTGTLVDLRMAALQARQLRLAKASPDDTQWLRNTLDGASQRFGVRFDVEPPDLISMRRA